MAAPHGDCLTGKVRIAPKASWRGGEAPERLPKAPAAEKDVESVSFVRRRRNSSSTCSGVAGAGQTACCFGQVLNP